MKRFAVLAAILAIGSVACGKSSTEPTSVNPVFTAALSPANEVPPVTGPESTGSGTATITFNVTRDAAGNITSGTVTFQANLTGFPAGTPLNVAHIHTGAAGVNGAVLINTTLAAGEVTASAAGTATINKPGIAVADPAILQNIVNNPAGFYFNVHSTLNPGGVIRGQLVKTAG